MKEEVKKHPIPVIFRFRTARWVEEPVAEPTYPGETKGEYVDHKEREQHRVVELEFTRDGKMKFHGGPTGHESYYLTAEIIQTLRGAARNGEGICICAGTTNSWPECTVPAQPIVDAFNEEFGPVVQPGGFLNAATDAGKAAMEAAR